MKYHVVTRHESVWASGVTHPFILNLEMVEQLQAETPLPLESEIAIFPKRTPRLWMKRRSFGFKSSSEHHQDDGSVLKRQSFVCTN
jgi:hypothetical protein